MTLSNTTIDHLIDALKWDYRGYAGGQNIEEANVLELSPILKLDIQENGGCYGFENEIGQSLICFNDENYNFRYQEHNGVGRGYRYTKRLKTDPLYSKQAKLDGFQVIQSINCFLYNIVEKFEKHPISKFYKDLREKIAFGLIDFCKPMKQAKWNPGW